MNAERLEGRLIGIVGPTHVLVAEQSTSYAVDGLTPQAVVFPADPQELSEVMRCASAEQLAVVPWGGGTQIGLGNIPARLDLVVGLKRLNGIVDYEPGDLTATFQAGMRLREVQASLRGSGQFLPVDPARCERATLGGILAANAGGPWRHRYGAARDLILGIRVVHADGTITKGGAKVVKSVSGYDMNKLYVGSLGTLGIVLEATCRLFPLPAVERTWVALFLTDEAAAAAVAKIVHSPIVCTRLELLSAAAAQSVGRQAGITVPTGTVAVLMSVGSMPEAVQTQIAGISERCNREGSVAGFPVEGDAQDQLWRAVGDCPSVSDNDRARIMLKASVLPMKVLETIRRAEMLARRLGMESAAVAEAGCGVVRLYWKDETGLSEQDPIAIAKAVEELRSWVLRDGGSLVILSAPSTIKAGVDVWGPVGNSLPLMQRLKAQFDPQQLLNPGRFVGGI